MSALDGAMEIAAKIPDGATTGYLVARMDGQGVQVAFRMADADLFALWGHIGEKLLEGTTNKLGAFAAMVSALAMHRDTLAGTAPPSAEIH